MTWHNPATNPPPPLEDVLIALRGEKKSFQGFCCNGEWVSATGDYIPADQVVTWAEMPDCPQIGGGS